MEHPDLLPEKHSQRPAFLRLFKTAGLGSERFEKKQDGADGTSAALPS
jgi:hypothetical protein